MPRTTIAVFTPLGGYDAYVADAANVTPAAMTGSSGSSGNQFVASGKDLVIAEETAGVAQTITFSSVNDPFGRTGDITAYSIGANELAVFGPFEVVGWRQTDNNIYFEANSANVKVVIAAIP